MHVTARYTLTPAEARRGNRAFRRRWYAGSLAGGLALTGLGLGGVLLAPEARQPGLFLALGGLLFAILPEVLLRRSLARRGALPQAPVEALLTDRGLTVRSGGGEGSLPWDGLRTIRRRGGFWIFQVSAHQAVLVPERALGPEGNAALADFLRDREGSRP